MRECLGKHSCMSSKCPIIIIIKKGRQWKAEREWYIPYQSEDPSPTIPTYRQKEERDWKKVEDYSLDRAA